MRSLAVAILLLGRTLATLAQAPFTLSNTLGSNMVLQRDSSATVLYGFGAPGVSVTTTFNGQKLTSPVGSDGVWRQFLPRTPAGGPYAIDIDASSGQHVSLTNVLFGDVFICGGQSNQQFTLAQAFNATEEIAKIGTTRYSSIRIFTVGQGTTSNVTLQQLGSILQPWVNATSATVGLDAWGSFSAVCWLTLRDIYDALNGTVPLGGISNNWGGTRIQTWSSPAALNACNASASTTATGAGMNDARKYASPSFLGGPDPNGLHVLWDSMILPYTVGPIAVKGLTWFQGESNAQEPAYYACAFPAMIADWRLHFMAPTAWFGFVFLEPWVDGPGTLPQTRDSQLAALDFVANVDYASMHDAGDPAGNPDGSIHPRNKQIAGSRLAAGALAHVYGFPNLVVAGPRYAASTCVTSGNAATVSVTFEPATLGSGLVYSSLAFDHCPTEQGVPVDQCAWYAILMSDGSKLNATASISANAKTFTLTAAIPGGSLLTAVGSESGYGVWPVVTLYNAEGFPSLPWSRKC